MTRSLATGVVLLSLFMAFTFCVAFAENNTTNTAKMNNATNVSENSTNITMLTNESTNATMTQNSTGNAANPFANAKGSVACDPGCQRVCAKPPKGGAMQCHCLCP
ncbi:MAG: hypothetical protein ACE14P_02300 [Methanotrichaceae archaeon]